MPAYRVYVMHPERTQICRYEELEAADDTAALGEAAVQADGSAFYLWTGSRMVCFDNAGRRPQRQRTNIPTGASSPA